MRNINTHLCRTKPNLYYEPMRLNIPNAVLVISNVELQNWRIDWKWQVFTPEGFQDEALPIFQLNHWLDGQDFISFTDSNSALLTEINSRFKKLCLPTPSENAVFESAFFQTINYRLDINFTDSGQFPSCKLADEKYSQIIAANMDVIGFDEQLKPGLIPILHGISVLKTPEIFENSDLVLPQK